MAKKQKNLSILDDQDHTKEKRKKKIITVACSLAGAAIAVLVCFGVYNLVSNRTPDDYGDYEKIAEIYKEKDIDYSYDDWKKDQEATKQEDEAEEVKEEDAETDDVNENPPALSNVASNDNVSDATKQLLSSNDQVLADAEEDSMISIDTAGLIQSLYDQTVDLNNFIDNHCGYGEEEYADSIFDGVRSYVDQLVASLSGGEAPENIYDYSIGQQQAEMRYCLFERVTFVGGNNYPQYNDIYSNYMAMGHPVLNSIDTISLEYLDEGEWFDDVYLANLKATVTQNGNVYTIYMASQIVDGGDSLYQILDVR